MINIDSMCLCGSHVKYDLCCRPFHENENTPVSAEALMRSRFTAFALQDSIYLLQTWDPEKRPKGIDFSEEKVEWTKLEILKTHEGLANNDTGIVEFKAFYSLAKEEYVMHEISRFKKIENRWFYIDGDVKLVEKVA